MFGCNTLLTFEVNGIYKNKADRMKNITKSNSLRTLLLSLSAIALMSGCQSTSSSTEETAYQRYKTAIDSAQSKQDFQVAREALKQAIEEAEGDPEMRILLVDLMASNLLVGKFGYYDQKGFIYWAKANGSDLNGQLAYQLKSVQKIKLSYSEQSYGLEAFYQNTKSLCDSNTLLVNYLAQDRENVALHVVGLNDCIQEKLLSNKQAQKAYAKYIQRFGSRDNSQDMAQGFKLLSQNKPYGELSKTQLKQVLMAKNQAFSLVSDSERPEFKWQGNSELATKVQKLLVKLNSDNDSDWREALGLVEQISAEPTLAEQNKGYLYYFVVQSAYLKNRQAPFNHYFDKLKQNELLSSSEVNAIETMRSLMYMESGDYRSGLAYLDNAIKQFQGI